MHAADATALYLHKEDADEDDASNDRDDWDDNDSVDGDADDAGDDDADAEAGVRRLSDYDDADAVDATFSLSLNRTFFGGAGRVRWRIWQAV